VWGVEIRHIPEKPLGIAEEASEVMFVNNLSVDIEKTFGILGSPKILS
jgi:hypothetical protein